MSMAEEGMVPQHEEGVSLGRRLRGRRALLLLVGYLLSHGLVWQVTLLLSGRTWGELLLGMDSRWYAEIASLGYDGQRWAFYPLFPLIVRATSHLLPFSMQVTGVLVSTLCLFCFYGVVNGWLLRAEARASPLAAPSSWALFLLMFSPSSFVLHANLTESLFLLLSFAAFYSAACGYFLRASLFAGLCALTRSQGVFVGMAVAAQLALMGASLRGRGKRFVLSGLISAGLFLLYPLYQAWQGGSPFLSVWAQKHWAHASSLQECVQTLWFGNAWQNTKPSSLAHHVWFFIMAFGVYLLRSQSLPLALYGFLSLAVMLMQGELVNAFRFSAVLFPVLFVLGESLGRQVPWVRMGLAALLVLVNLAMTASYALGRWAY